MSDPIVDHAHSPADTAPGAARLLSGTQALIEILLLQAERDRRTGLRTGGFVSGYRGSPLGGLDQALWRRQSELESANIRFLPGINEELAVTAVQGSQQAGIDPEATFDGVFGMWYGKGPGVDRAGDALKHAHAFGSAPQGGVLVVAGDDHGAVSTSYSQQSEQAMIGWRMPVLNPADVRDYLEFGLYGYALSRFSGAWVGFKAISESVEATVTTNLPDPEHRYTIPNFTFPADGVHIRWPDYPSQAIEERLEVKLSAVLAFARANPIDRAVLGDGHAWLGIVATGKAFRDLQEALRLLGIDDAEAVRIGLRVYKVGLSYPLESEGLLRFAAGLEMILVVEEKRPVVEAQIKELFYNAPSDARPVILGKRDAAGAELLPEIAEMRPWIVAKALVVCLSRRSGMERFADIAAGLVPEVSLPVPSPQRRPYFCSGCPHSSSTRVPAGSRGQAGIGCHVMACWMDRDTAFITQMGGEGVNWVGHSAFTGTRHVFQNLGDGTYYHSGSLALRQAVAAKVNITYKILFNGAVAMTGGQAVDGPLSTAAITHQARHEGVARIAVVSDTPTRHDTKDFAAGTTLHHRKDLEAVQLELRDIPGVSVLVYDQLCATEKRRREKRAEIAAPARHVVINDAVCDGCGDCGKVSNCLSIVPRPSPFGLKRVVDQTSCNKDMTCVDGYCPSFVTVVGGRRRKPALNGLAERIASLPPPSQPVRTGADILFAGIGGTGVVTVARILAKAADLDGKAVSALDFTGFAQKGGAVLSHARITASGQPNQARIAAGQCDVLIACDLVVACGNDPLQAIGRHRTRIVANSHVGPTGDFTRYPKLLPDGEALSAFLDARAGDGALTAIDASDLAERLFGSNVMANMILLGVAFQQGLLPVSLGALEQAIAGMETAGDDNRLAFGAGRLAVAEPEFAMSTAVESVQAPAELPTRVAFFAGHLAACHGTAAADKLRALVRTVHAAENTVMPGASRLAGAVVAGYAHLLADKDEYEVARQLSGAGFLDGLQQSFEGPWRLEFHFAHPWLSRWFKGKLTVPGGVALPLLRLLARARRLRGTMLDPFRFGQERRNARRLAAQYEADIAWVLARLDGATYDSAVELAELPDSIRGYGRVRESHAEIAQSRRQRLLDIIAKEAPGTGQGIPIQEKAA